MNMLFVWIFLPEVLWMYTTSFTGNLWKSEMFVCVIQICHFQLCYTSKKVSIQTNKQTKKYDKQSGIRTLLWYCFVVFLAYIRPVLSFDCLLSLFSLLEGYTGCIIDCEYLFSFIYCLHATACYFQKRSEISQAHLGCTVNNVTPGHLIYLINVNTVANLMSVILVAVDVVAVLCIIKTRANSVTVDYFCYCYKNLTMWLWPQLSPKWPFSVL